MLGNVILKLLERGLSGRLRGGRVCEGEYVLSEGEIGIFGVLRVGAHCGGIEGGREDDGSTQMSQALGIRFLELISELDDGTKLVGQNMKLFL